MPLVVVAVQPCVGASSEALRALDRLLVRAALWNLDVTGRLVTMLPRRESPLDSVDVRAATSVH